MESNKGILIAGLIGPTALMAATPRLDMMKYDARNAIKTLNSKFLRKLRPILYIMHSSGAGLL